MRVFVRSHIGNVRSINEDSYYTPLEGERFAAIADGMGGHLAGEVASKMAVDTFSETIRGLKPSAEVLKLAIGAANTNIYRAAQRDPLKHGMGTTMTALCFDEGNAFLAHVGDSRAYLLRNGALMQMTRDHSLVSEMIEMGVLTPDEAKVHPQRNFITRALGTNAHVEPDITPLEREAGDVWLLCSDGLTDYLRLGELSETLKRPISREAQLDALVLVALERGGADNITCMIVDGEEDDPR